MSSRRDQQSSEGTVDTAVRNHDLQHAVVYTDKIAIVDTDILHHWALTFSEDDATLEECFQEAEKVILNFEKSLVAKAYVYFIKGRGNFRYQVATMKPYKGTRSSGEDRHRFYYEVLNHIIKFRDCIESHGYEADDMVSVFHSEKTVVCTIDKDAKQNAGDLYNLRTHELVTISEEEAWRNLWMQVLTGDKVDNIGGIEGIGPGKAEKILEGIGAASYPQEVLNQYIIKYGIQDGSDFFNENYQLIRMKSSAGKYIKEQYKDIFALIEVLHEL